MLRKGVQPIWVPGDLAKFAADYRVFFLGMGKADCCCDEILKVKDAEAARMPCEGGA